MVRSTRKNRMNRNHDFWTWMQRFTNPLQLQMLKNVLRQLMSSIRWEKITQILVWVQLLADLSQIVETSQEIFFPR